MVKYGKVANMDHLISPMFSLETKGHTAAFGTGAPLLGKFLGFGQALGCL